MVNPENVFDIMRAMQRVLTDQSLRDKLKTRGYDQVRKFSWETSARRLDEVYHSVCGGSPASVNDSLAKL
jgi:glycosyltransferase involved in cell wall biosynthesis